MSVTMSTNGSIRSEKMCELLNRIGDYIASIYPEFYGTTYHDWLDQLDEIKKIIIQHFMELLVQLRSRHMSI